MVSENRKYYRSKQSSTETRNQGCQVLRSSGASCYAVIEPASTLSRWFTRSQ